MTGRVTLQFHPDWPFRDGLVIESMAADGCYRSQFETGTSNGGLTAFPGGDRWGWESRLFGGRYDEGPVADRPLYGALDHAERAHGGSIRFGSAYVRLRSEVTQRSTFCFPDSWFEPATVGGPEFVELAQSLGAVLTPAVIGDAARTGLHDPQSLKRVWHLLARFGRSGA